MNSKKKDAHQVHKYRNYTLKRSCVFCQCNVKVLDEVLRRAGLQNNHIFKLIETERAALCKQLVSVLPYLQMGGDLLQMSCYF